MLLTRRTVLIRKPGCIFLTILTLIPLLTISESLIESNEKEMQKVKDASRAFKAAEMGTGQPH